jgi:hypothetical protein
MQSTPFWRKGQAMKTKGTKGIAAAVVGTVLLVGSPAWAGTKLTQEVQVFATGAYGAMRAARNSADNLQHIGCYGDFWKRFSLPDSLPLDGGGRGWG